VDALDLLAADEIRRQRHRLTGTPMRDVRQLRAFLTERAIALETGSGALPSLAAAIAGRRLAGSWMAQPEVGLIYRLLERLAEDEFPSVPLIEGKQVRLHLRLAPAVQRIAADPGRRQSAIAGLSPLAGRLFADVEASGEVGIDDWPAPSSKERTAARRELQTSLLVSNRTVHTERGHHTSVVSPWSSSALATRYGVAADRLSLAQAEDTLLGAALTAAVYAPEREVERWFPFDAAPSIARLLDAGLVARTDDRKPLLVASS
jgi:hypothetical protein